MLNSYLKMLEIGKFLKSRYRLYQNVVIDHITLLLPDYSWKINSLVLHFMA